MQTNKGDPEILVARVTVGKYKRLLQPKRVRQPACPQSARKNEQCISLKLLPFIADHPVYEVCSKDYGRVFLAGNRTQPVAQSFCLIA